MPWSATPLVIKTHYLTRSRNARALGRFIQRIANLHQSDYNHCPPLSPSVMYTDVFWTSFQYTPLQLWPRFLMLVKDLTVHEAMYISCRDEDSVLHTFCAH